MRMHHDGHAYDGMTCIHACAAAECYGRVDFGDGTISDTRRQNPDLVSRHFDTFRSGRRSSKKLERKRSLMVTMIPRIDDEESERCNGL
jgi:hypothetical protein